MNQNELLRNANENLMCKFSQSDEPVVSLYTQDFAVKPGLVAYITNIMFDVIPNVPYSTSDMYVSSKVGDPVLVSRAGEPPVALFLILNDGLQRLQIDELFESPKSSIIIYDGVKTPFTELKSKDLWQLIGDKVQCTACYYDDEVMVQSVDKNGHAIMRPARTYEFKLISEY